MVRTLRYSLAGAGVGFFVGLVLVILLSRMGGGPVSVSDIVTATVFFGGFLAGPGAIAGAVIGGVADLLAYFRRRDEALRQAQAQRDSEFER
jgi:NhaP-type Na+/H+ or K+/H+ antiporter